MQNEETIFKISTVSVCVSNSCDLHCRLTIDLGSSKTIQGRHSVLLGDNLADYRWHTVRVVRSGPKLDITLDNNRRSSSTRSTSEVLQLNHYIFVGGVDRTLSDDYHGADRVPQFIGCIRDIIFDSYDVLALGHSPNYRGVGSPKYECSRVEYKPIGFPSPRAHLSLTNYHSPRSFSLDFKFRSYDGNGAIAVKFAKRGKVFLNLVSGALTLKVKVGTNRPLSVTVGKGLGDGEWHNVSVGVNRNEMWLILDNQPEVQHQNPQLKQMGHFRMYLFIGGVTNRVGFVGCMRDLRVNNQSVDPRKLLPEEMVETTQSCNVTSRCLPNPCRNGRRCHQTWNDFSCDCQVMFLQNCIYLFHFQFKAYAYMVVPRMDPPKFVFREVPENELNESSEACREVSFRFWFIDHRKTHFGVSAKER